VLPCDIIVCNEANARKYHAISMQANQAGIMKSKVRGISPSLKGPLYNQRPPEVVAPGDQNHAPTKQFKGVASYEKIFGFREFHNVSLGRLFSEHRQCS
jgi:hypothetical protein